MFNKDDVPGLVRALKMKGLNSGQGGHLPEELETSLTEPWMQVDYY